MRGTGFRDARPPSALGSSQYAEPARGPAPPTCRPSALASSGLVALCGFTVSNAFAVRPETASSPLGERAARGRCGDGIDRTVRAARRQAGADWLRRRATHFRAVLLYRVGLCGRPVRSACTDRALKGCRGAANDATVAGQGGTPSRTAGLAAAMRHSFPRWATLASPSSAAVRYAAHVPCEP